jgi:hypothetical protein
MNTPNNSNNPKAFDQGTQSSLESAGAQDLSGFDDYYAEAEAPDLEEVPDGKYQARINTVKLSQSQKGDPMIKWDTMIISGPHAGRHIFKNSVITQASLPFVKGDLQTLGLKLNKFSELPAHLDALLDLAVEITKRQKNEYSNVYFNRLLDIPNDGKADSEEPAPF